MLYEHYMHYSSDSFTVTTAAVTARMQLVIHLVIVVVHCCVQEEQYHKRTLPETMEHFSSSTNETTKLLNSPSYVSKPF